MNVKELSIDILSDASELIALLESAESRGVFPEAVEASELFQVNSVLVDSKTLVTVWEPSPYLRGFVKALNLQGEA